MQWLQSSATQPRRHFRPSGNLGVQDVLKVVPAPGIRLLREGLRGKCKLHKEVAEETEHVVSIRDMFDEDVVFDGESTRAVAIDLGSLSDASKSDPGAVRLPAIFAR